MPGAPPESFTRRFAITTKFPGAKDDATTLANNRTNTTPATNQHPVDHNNEADAIVALETKVGIDNSPDANSLDSLVRRQPFSKTATILSPTAAINVVVWRAPYACTVTAVRARRDGGSTSTINARRGTSNHLATALSLPTDGAWASNTTPQNASYVAGDTLEAMIVSLGGAPTSIAIQVEFEKA